MRRAIQVPTKYTTEEIQMIETEPELQVNAARRARYARNKDKLNAKRRAKYAAGKKSK